MIGEENDGKNGILGCKKINKNSVYGLCNFINRKSTALKYLYLLFFWEIKMEEKWNKKITMQDIHSDFRLVLLFVICLMFF